MKKLLFGFLVLGNVGFAQVNQATTITTLPITANDLKMTSDYGPKEAELIDWMRFENLDYYQVKFTGKELPSKNYTIRVKEIWGGKVKSESLVFDSKELKSMGLDKVNDTAISFKVIGKLTSSHQLKLSFIFPRFSITRTYKALNDPEYSLRNLADESKLDLGYDKPFHFMAYILPYKRSDGSKSWCEVGGSGKDIENWGKKFGVKHYLVFDLVFE